MVALLLTQAELDGVTHNQAVAFFASTALNRVHWIGHTLTWLPYTDQSFAANKYTLRNLAVACVAYLTCINLTLTLHEAPAQVQKRRAREGKAPILPYYTVDVAPAYREPEGAGGREPARLSLRRARPLPAPGRWPADLGALPPARAGT